MIYVFYPLFEQICVHYKNLENEEKQTKMKQKAFIMLPASKDLCTCLQTVFFKTHFLWSGHEKTS